MKKITLRERGTSTVTVLLSGGIDSTTCVAFYLARGLRVDALFVEYGQRAVRRERHAAQRLASHYKVRLRTIKLVPVKTKAAGVILGRNAFLLSTALLEAREHRDLVAIGIHSGTTYTDCSPNFIRRMQAVFDICSAGAIQIVAPFQKWTKHEIWAFARREGVPLHLTYSCERGVRQPCHSCASCFDLEKLHVGTSHKN